MKHIYQYSIVVLVILLGFNFGTNAQTSTYTYTGAPQTYTVPAGVTTISVDVIGGQGGGKQCGYGAGEYQSTGGCGGRVQATINVTPGHVLNVIVGGGGIGDNTSTALVYGGGGKVGGWNTTYPAASGGGGSTILDVTSGATLVVAGGGGGGGGNWCSSAGVLTGVGDHGGDGGGLVGAAGNSDACGVGNGGQGGTQVAGGVAPACGGFAGMNGSAGTGGNSVTVGLTTCGAGGGGYYGGASGAYSSGGGGGSSYTNPLYTSAVIHTQGYNCIPIPNKTTPGANGQVTITVNCNAGTITGSGLLCVGGNTPLTDATVGGTWSSGNTAVATVSGTGLVTGVGAGTATISYTVGGCSATFIVTVSSVPTAILGTLTVCAGATTTLTDAVTGGTWTSSNTGIATITGAGLGLVNGLTPGTSTIVYYMAGGACSISAVVTVNPTPSAISGTPAVCAGLTTTLSDAFAGTWSSSNTAIATIGAASGLLGGVAAGTSTIIFTTPLNCTASVVATVYPTPVAITGTTSLCLGQVAIMSDGTTGGTWTSSNTAVATIVAGSGFTTAVGVGTTSITYMLPAGCIATMTLSVNPVPAPINGNTQVCGGLTDNLTDITAGGTWSSSNTSVATIDPATGIVNAYIGGTTTISYMLATGCSSTMILTVNPSPVAISGNFNLCVGLSNLLTDASAGGTWSSSDPAIASIVSGTGLATGVATGTATITYMLSAGCTATSNVTVNAVPGAINGTTNGCIGTTTTLTDATSGGLWSSSNTGVATIGVVSGMITTVSSGTTTISYTLTASGCYVTTTFTVNPPPAAISGTPVICQGNSVTFNDGTGGGNWSSSNIAIATVNASGLVTGVSPGPVNISYTLPTTCYSIYATTIEASPTAINGSSTVCVGSAVTLSDNITGGTWSIAAGSGTAAISSATGIVTGLTPGTVIVTYATCSPVSTVMSVNPLPSAILGEGSVCQGSSTTVSDATPGGTWSISPGASISPSGVITGISTAGAVIVTYTLPTSCYITVPISVSPIPSPIQGVDSVCPGSSVILTDATADGVWSSSDGTIAHATAFTGEILGMVHGDVTITYSLVSGCYTVTPFHVETPIPVFLSVTTNPIDTFLCTDVPVTLTASVTPAVGSPTFQWEIFGSYVGAGSVYTYNPLHADFITCLMTMNGACTSPTAINKDVTLNVWPLAGPTVVVTCTQPDTAAYMGEVYTFYTTVTFGGPSPSYQWYINNAPVGGATHPVFTTPVYNENDSVYCVVNGNSPCDTGSYVGTSNGKIIYGQGWLSVSNVKTGSNDLSLFPNPNTGSFTLSGTVSAGQDKEVTLEVTDMLGRTVYTGTTMPQNGTIKAEITLGNEAAGSYLLRVNTESGSQAFHFVISK